MKVVRLRDGRAVNVYCLPSNTLDYRKEAALRGEIMFPLSTPLLLAGPLLGLCQAAPVSIVVDVSRVVGPNDNKLWANLGFDPLYAELTAEQTQPVLEMIRESRAFRYLRCHNYFSDGLPIRRGTYFGCRIYREDENGRPIYQWWFLDEVLDRMLAAGLRPIVECDFMPDALAEGEPLRNYGGGLVNTPKDYEKWRDLVYHTVRHCRERYGAEEVRQWYWEIWNEPDLYRYFIDGMGRGAPHQWSPRLVERLNKMYDYFVAGATAADPQVKVGGPGIAGYPQYLRAFLDHCVSGTNYVTGQKGTRIDFISWHGYGYTPALLAKNRRFKELIRREFPSLADREVQQNEWGQPLFLNRRPHRSLSFYTEYEAAFLCRYVDAMYSVPEASVDLFLKWGRLTAGPWGGWRTLTRYVGDRPAPAPVFHAYVLLSKLGPERVAVTQGDFSQPVRALAARTGPQAAQVLLYHFAERNEEGTGEPARVNLTVQGLAGLVARVRKYQIDRTHSNFFRAWERLGRPRPEQLTPQQIAQIHEAAQLAFTDQVDILQSGGGRISLEVELPVNSVVLLVLNEEYRREWRPGPHIQRVLEAEAAYQAAQRRAEAGQWAAAREAFRRVAETYRDLFWGQKALFALVRVYEEGLREKEAADRVRQELLRTPLGDDVRMELLTARVEYLRGAGREDEATALEREREALRPLLQRGPRWTP